MLLRDFVTVLNKDSPQLSESLTVAVFVRFASLAAKVQHHATESLGLTPYRHTVLPFLALALAPGYPHETMGDLWQLLFPLLPGCQINTASCIRKLGLHESLNTKSQLPERFLRAPMNNCTICLQALHIHSRVNGYLYDVDGVHAVQTVILCCSNAQCGTYHRPSYYTRDGFRIYYSEEMGRNTDYLHIHCHYYMTRRLAYHFRVIQMLAHVSHFNLVNWFNEVFVDQTHIPTFVSDQKFNPSMSEETCRDGLILHSLMNHADRRRTQLAVTASGNDTIRFDSAMESHLEMLSAEGTRYRDHYCSSCVRITSAVDPETGEQFLKAIRAVVTDGLTIGHWRCSASTQQLKEIAAAHGLPAPEGPCTKRLDSINDRFCPEHFEILGGRCRVQPCAKAAIADTQTCDDKDHIEAWKSWQQKVKAQLADVEAIQQADESQRAHEGARDGGDSQAAGKYTIARSLTHNEQLAVAPCGIVLARKTFYHAESVSAVKDFLEESFPRGMPEVVFYDNACRLTEHIYTGHSDPARFSGTVIPVDPFHHWSHAGTDEFCKKFTDPKLFPDIQEGGRWIFNASAAELTNIWYGGFASMCRSMHSLAYNFFLEEMVYLRNYWLTKKLDKRKGMQYLGEGMLW